MFSNKLKINTSTVRILFMDYSPFDRYCYEEDYFGHAAAGGRAPEEQVDFQHMRGFWPEHVTVLLYHTLPVRLHSRSFTHVVSLPNSYMISITKTDPPTPTGQPN